MSASGVRVGCFEELKIKHLTDMSNGCKSVNVYADSIHEYHTFIHQEAVDSLNEYLDSRKRKGEQITGNSWVFCSPFDTSKPHPADTITSTLGRYVKKSIGREKSKSGRYSIMSCHGFRKRFDTVLKLNRTVNLSLAERLMGHSQTIPLDNSYFKPVIEQLFDEYQKAIPELIIDEKYRLEKEIENKNKQIHKMESDKDQRILDLELKIGQITSLLENATLSHDFLVKKRSDVK
jgi:integrase/recombinase XerD